MAEGEHERWARALKKCLPQAEKYLDVGPFLSALQAQNILNHYEYANVVKDSNNAIERVRLVFEAAGRKDVQYIKKFVEILDNPGAGQWAEMIRKEAGSLDQPLPAAEGACAAPVMYTYPQFLAVHVVAHITLVISLTTMAVISLSTNQP